MAIQPVEVKRDENGMFCHPDYPNFSEEQTSEQLKQQFKQFEANNNITVKVTYMEDELPDFAERWVDEGLSDCSQWEPRIPEGSFILGIWDTEDLPVCVYAVPS